MTKLKLKKKLNNICKRFWKHKTLRNNLTKYVQNAENYKTFLGEHKDDLN